jgi:predicted nucleotidyltransferase
LAAASAAKPVTRATAERALSQFLERVTRVNENPYFLAKATKVVLFGSMLKPEVDRLSDVDLVVELARKETDVERAGLRNRQRAEDLAKQGRRFRNFLKWEACWYLETFQFLKGRSRVISLADYSVEKALVLAVPHRVLIDETEAAASASTRAAPRASSGNRVRATARSDGGDWRRRAGRAQRPIMQAFYFQLVTSIITHRGGYVWLIRAGNLDYFLEGVLSSPIRLLMGVN